MAHAARDASKAPVVIAAGGTGGHLFPAQALAQELARRGWPIVVVTDARGENFVEGFPDAEIIGVAAATFAGRGPLGRLDAVVRIVTGIGEAYRQLKRLRPAAVIGFGGYPSLPAMIAALFAGVPTCIHEQNAVLGRVNRKLAPFIGCIASTFPRLSGLPARARAKLVVTGNPLRDAVIAYAHAPYAPPDPADAIRLLVFGGSQGARVFAELVPAALARLPDAIKARLKVVQQARRDDEARVREALTGAQIAAEVAPFFTDLPARMAGAHLVIARAGASTVCELAAIGRPALLVPLPTAMDDHQTVNAAFLTDAGAAWAFRERELTPDRLATELAAILENPATLADAARHAATLGRPEATRALADLVEHLIGNPVRRDVVRTARSAPPLERSDFSVLEYAP